MNGYIYLNTIDYTWIKVQRWFCMCFTEIRETLDNVYCYSRRDLVSELLSEFTTVETICVTVLYLGNSVFTSYRSTSLVCEVSTSQCFVSSWAKKSLHRTPIMS